MFQVRKTKPTTGNKFYITKSKGGYSSCIQGSPTDSKCNVLANCVGYACGRFNEIIGSMKYPLLNCNAENFIERAKTLGLSIVKEPVAGGIMVWQKGATLSGNDGAGHVAAVEKVNNKDQVYTSESGYGGSAFWNATRNRGNGNWGAGSGYKYRGCIVNPSVKNESVPKPKPKPTDPFPGVSDETLAARVWSGEFGNGEARKKALGNRYAAVQALVDKGVGKPTPQPMPQPTSQPKGLQVGDAVKIIKHGNGSAYGTSGTASGIGWTRYITKIYEGKPFPYQVGNKGKTDSANTTGFYKADALQKL